MSTQARVQQQPPAVDSCIHDIALACLTISQQENWHLLLCLTIAEVLSDAHRSVRVVSAAAGIKHSVALASDGSLFTWGDGSRGQLGHSSLHSMSTAGVSSNIKLLLPQKIARLDPAGLTPENRCVMLQMMLCLLLRTTRKRLAFYCYAWLRHVKWHYPAHRAGSLQPLLATTIR